jgi:hypothetical protein
VIDLPTIDELREARRRLAEENGLDPHRYAAMLEQQARSLPGTYVTKPLTPSPAVPPTAVKAS